MITEATPTEYSVTIQIHAVMQAAYALEAERIGFAEFPPLGESLEELRQSSDSFLVFQQSGSIIGGLSYRRGTDTVAITRLVVSPEHLRQGIATALLSELESRLFPITCLSVPTVKDAGRASVAKAQAPLEEGSGCLLFLAHYSDALVHEFFVLVAHLFITSIAARDSSFQTPGCFGPKRVQLRCGFPHQ